jgi:hypothetical protein
MILKLIAVAILEFCKPADETLGSRKSRNIFIPFV